MELYDEQPPDELSEDDLRRMERQWGEMLRSMGDWYASKAGQAYFIKKWTKEIVKEMNDYAIHGK